MGDFIRILIIEDEPFWQRMVTQQLNLNPEFLVIGIANTVQQAIEMGKVADYDFAIIDLQLDQTAEDGFRVYQELKKVKDFKAIFLTSVEEPKSMYNAFLLGVFSYIPKKHLNVIGQTILYLHDNAVPEIFMNAVYDQIKEFRLYDLTTTEKNIFKLLREGLRPKDIAAHLNISLYTVRSHIRNVLKKIEVNTYREALQKLYCGRDLIHSPNHSERSN